MVGPISNRPDLQTNDVFMGEVLPMVKYILSLRVVPTTLGRRVLGLYLIFGLGSLSNLQIFTWLQGRGVKRRGVLGGGSGSCVA